MKGGVDSFDEKGDNNISNEEEELLGQCLSTVKEESPRDHEMMKSDDSQMVQVQRRTTPPVIQRGMIKLGMKIGDTMDRFRPSSVGSSPGSMFSKRSKNAKSSGFTTSFLDANEESICNEENMDELLSAFDETELRKMFEEADVDRSGYLDHGELRELLKNWSKLSALNSNEVSVLMRLYDADSSGTIDYDEFLELATALSDDTSRQKLHRSIQEYMEEIDSSMHQSVDDSMHLDTGRLKVLALHGSGDNMRVTQLQVANLGLDKQKIDFVYINGPFESGPSVAQATVEGPYYTWLSSGDDSHPKKLNQIQTNILALRKVIIDAISKYGPFDGVFGFSLGGALALALMQSDVLQVLDTGTCDQKNFKRYNKDRASANNFPKNDSSPHHSFVPNNFDLEEPQIDVNTLQDGFTSNFCHKPPFKFAIVACPASLDRIRLGLGLEAKSLSNGLAQARTVHLIGTRDSLKADGDYNILQYCTLYPENSLHEKMDYSTLAGPRAVNALAKYLPIGHELPRTLRNYGALALSIIDFIEKSPYTKLPSICRWPYKKHDASLAASPQSITSNDNREVLYSGVAPIGAPRTQNIQISSIAYAKLENDHQIMEVDLRPPPECASLITALKAAPHDKIYLRGHRRSGGKHDLDQSRTNHHHRYRVEVTFGDLLNCISEGADDIRASLRLGGDNDEMLAGVSPLAPPTLAYATPPDGPASAAAAIAFFTFASLGAAAPLDAGTLESDAYDAFDQLNATTVIVWRDGIEEGIRAAAVRLGARLFEATLRTKRPLDWFFDDIYLPDEDHESSIVYRCRQAYKDAISMNIEVFKPFEEMKSQISNQNIQHVKIANGTPQNKFQQKPDHVALLLRTSGTTSKPKIVALTQSQLVTNGMALATNLELTPEDICLNAMPLFHIGGLSASILATLAAKSSVTCISGTFKAEYFAMHLGFPIDTQEDGGITQHSVSSVSTNMSGTVHSPNVSPQQSQQKKSTGRKLNSSISMSTIDNTYNDIPLPTWYSAVPTMHNAIVSYLKKYEPLSPNKKDELSGEQRFRKNDDSFQVDMPCYHRIRFVRSGAAALSPYDARRLSATFGGVPVLATYSMSEQMPISQPPLDYGRRQLDIKPGTVGVAVATCLAVVTDMLEPISDDPYDMYGGTKHRRNASSFSSKSSRNYQDERVLLRGPSSLHHLGKLGASLQKITPQSSRPSLQSNLDIKRQLQRRPGQIAICGPTVMKEYLNNPNANASSFFILGGRRWFLTGDVGYLDDEGHLRLTGRSKELIKRGGEQVSPYEVEDCLIEDDLISIAVAFAVPSALWGEEVGVAIVPNKPEKLDRNDIRGWTKIVRDRCTQLQLASYKIPTHIIVVDESTLPKTKTKKFIRTNLAKELLGISEEGIKKIMDPSGSVADLEAIGNNRGPPNVALAISGARFVLVLWTMIQHIGSGRSFGKWRRTRGFNLHMPMFFALAGFQLASGMAPPPSKLKFLSKSHRIYFWARFSAVHPLYLLSILCCALILLIGCRPDTYRQEFNVEADKNYDKNFNWRWSVSERGDGNDVKTHAFCEPTPINLGSWSGSYISTIFIYLFGLQAWPFALPIAWFLSYYTWFQSVYYYCLFIFPFVYRYLYKLRGNARKLLMVMFFFFMMNNIVCGIYLLNFITWARHWRHKATLALALYLFPPFWAPYFFGGATAAFLLDCFRPYERQQTIKRWARIGDITSIYFAAVVLLLRFIPYSIFPPAVKHNKLLLRIWLYTLSRLHFPFVFAWIYALAVGGGFVAQFLGSDTLAKTLGPLSFAAYLFHQIVGALYYALTRNAVWNWWRYRKFFYWFSPYPLPVPWYEAIWVMVLTLGLSKVLTDYVNPILISIWSTSTRKISRLGTTDQKVSTLDTVCDVIFQLTGTEVEPDNTLEQCGLASVGLPVLIRMLTSALPGLTITAADFVSAQTLRELAIAIDLRLAHNEAAHIM